MNRIRFQVGVPRAGDAARMSEGEPRLRSLSSLAGSAARAAEEAKRTEAASGVPGARTISMRATGGRVMEPQATPAATSADAPPAQATPMSIAPATGFAQSSTEPVCSDTKVSARNQAEDADQPGVLQTAAARVQSLVHSLFSGGRAH